MTRATRRIRALAARVFSPATMDRLVDPILGDIELESRAHLDAGRRWRTRGVVLSGYAGLFRATVLHTLHVCAGALVFDEAGKRTMLVSVVALAVLTIALMLPPLLSAPEFARHPGLAVYLVPQAIPISIPVALSIGIVWGWSTRMNGRAMFRRVVVVGTAGAMISLATMEWLVPAANDGFRVTLTRLLAPDGIKPTIPRGINDRSLSELAVLIQRIQRTSQIVPFDVTEYERLLKDLQGLGTTGPGRRRPLRLEDLKLALHVRVALAFATFALAILAVATTAAIRRKNLARTVFAGLVLLYISSWFGVEAIAPAVSPVISPWLPNAGTAALSAVLLTRSVLRRDQLAPTEA